MIIKDIEGITVITADEGMTLKSKNEEVISKEFWLGFYDNVENYVEIVENLTE